MGDRAIVYVKNGIDWAPCGVYVHWGGESILDDLKKALSRMRCEDEEYSMARLIGCLHEEIDGNTGLGVVGHPSDKEDIYNFSPGDAGVLVYDCGNGKVKLYDGYLRDKHGEEIEIGVPPE